MIDLALNQVSLLLNQYLKHTFDLNEDIVVVSNIVDQDGTLSSNVNNRVVIFLVNISRDTEATSASGGFLGSSRSILNQPPVFLNVHVIVAANFPGNNYLESLKFLSHCIGFFQRYPVFDHHNSPELDRSIEKLILDIENVSFNDLSNIWNTVGGKYIPSVLYKMRMVTIDTKPVKGVVHLVHQPTSEVR